MAQLFYQSLQIEPALLREFENNAKTQEDLILNIFTQVPDITKSELFEIFNHNGKLISESSISRSLTNMTERLQITMTNEKRIGIWGKPNTVYKIVTDENREEAERQIKQTVTVKLTQEELDSLYFCIDEFIEQNRDNTDYNEVLFTHLQNAYSKLIKKVK